VASVRGRADPDESGTWQIGRLLLAPDLEDRGLDRELVAFAEGQAPAGTTAYELSLGTVPERTLRAFRRAGYRVRPGEGGGPGTAVLTKRVR
jgi:tRNA (guanine37-N1)-methyltransferase